MFNRLLLATDGSELSDNAAMRTGETALQELPMKRPSSATTALVIFWVGYAIVMAFLLYAALPPVNLELLLILGGAEAVFVVVALAVAYRSRLNRSTSERA